MTEATVIRSMWGACRVPGTEPHDTVHYRVLHRARPTGSDMEKNTGEIPPDSEGAPFPLVVFCVGINVPPDGYRWLAERLAAAGFPTVLYQVVGEHLPGVVGITPGLEIDAVRPDSYPERVVSPAIGSILASISATPLAGFLDLERVILGGHSAGGTVALLSAQHTPGCVGVFTFGAHAGASTMLGWPEATILGINSEVPVLLMAGTEDEVIRFSAHRYGGPGKDPVDRTFEESISSGWLGRIEGAGHFAAVHPIDPTTARAFLETAKPDPAHRETIASWSIDFCRAVTGDTGAKAVLDASLQHRTSA